VEVPRGSLIDTDQMHFPLAALLPGTLRFACVCVRVCVCVCAYAYVCTRVCGLMQIKCTLCALSLPFTYVCMYVCVCVCVYLCMNTDQVHFVRLLELSVKNVCMQACMHLSMCADQVHLVRTQMKEFVCMYVYTYVRT
jgi:hypothetical protein